MFARFILNRFYPRSHYLDPDSIFHFIKARASIFQLSFIYFITLSLDFGQINLMDFYSLPRSIAKMKQLLGLGACFSGYQSHLHQFH